MLKALLFGACPLLLAAQSTLPTFQTRYDYNVSGHVAVADLNGDGIPDIVADSAYTAQTLLGNGDGTFQSGPVSAWRFSLANFILVDVNGDGYPDLVMSGGPNGIAVPSGIGVSFGNGDGSFQNPILYQAGTDKFLGEVAVGDFNGDGILDLETCAESGVWLFTGKGGGVFNSGVLIPATGVTSQPLVAADFNGDGYLDLAVGYYNRNPPYGSGFLVFFGNGDGTFQAPVEHGGGPLAQQFLAAGDLNLDGHPDIVTVPDHEGVDYALVFLNDGSGGFAEPFSVSFPGITWFTIGDLNGDGIPDLVNSLGLLHLGRGMADSIRQLSIQ